MYYNLQHPVSSVGAVMSSTNGGQETREEQLRHHVAQLKEEVEKEKAEKRQIHQDKVREVKATRELEQANAREQLEKLKAKLQNEKAQELQVRRVQDTFFCSA